MRLLTLLTTLVLAAFTAAAPVNDISPASPLLEARSCSSPACALVTFADYTQVNWNNVQCSNMGQEVIGVLVGECYCALWGNEGCSDLVQEIFPCPGLINSFKKPVKSISCGGWAGRHSV